MEICELQKTAEEIIAKIDNKLGISHTDELTINHLAEEIGELARQINNPNIRKIPKDNKNLKEEIADVILLVTKIANNNNVDLSDAITGKISRLEERHNLVLEKQKAYKLSSSKNINMLPGNPQGLPDESFISKDTLIFIDSGFLSKVSKHFGSGKYLVYDLIEFSENLCKKQKLVCKKIFYYTAPPFQSSAPTSEEEKKKDGYDRFIRKLKEKEITVREGRCQRLKCEGEFIYKQKAVDILLAMDLMSVPLNYPKIKRIIIISSDSDFVPVIEKLKENEIKTVLHTYYEKIRDAPFSRSNHLIKSVHKYVLLTKEDFLKFPIKK